MSLCLVVLGVSGCATYDPNQHYDPNATEKIGKVIDKQVARFETRSDSQNLTPMYSYPPNAAIYALVHNVAIMGEYLKKKPEIPIYGYRIKIGDSEEIVVHSEFPGHDIGNCVKVFLSSRPDYPRIASWSGC